MRSWFLPLVIVAGVAASAPPKAPQLGGESSPAEAAAAFARALRPGSLTAASFAFDDPLRLDWHYVPRERRGLPLGAMDDSERRATHALLRTLLTPIGYERVQGVMELEAVLREIEGNPGRDPGRYFVQRFGEPFGHGASGLRIEGHHLALNFTSVEGRGVVTTPFFLGANPAEVASGPQAGRMLLAEFEESARALARSFSPEQLRMARIAESAPADVLFGPGAAAPDLALGIAEAALEPGQRAQLAALEATVTGMVAAFGPEAVEGTEAQAAVATVAAGRGDSTRFAWAGSLEPSNGHYWRIARADAVIEYDNTQNGANHAHLLWRDPSNDFATGWLASHRAAERARERSSDGSGR